MMRATEQSPRMFASDIVDFFSRTHPVVVPVLFVPASLGLLWHSVTQANVSLVASLGLALTGFFAWTLTEYWLHRLFFHWQPGGKWGERMHFLVHGVHHKCRGTSTAWSCRRGEHFAFFAFLGFILLLGVACHVGRSTPGSSWVHGVRSDARLHFPLQPESEYGRKIKKHHMLPTSRARQPFGVSNMGGTAYSYSELSSGEPTDGAEKSQEDRADGGERARVATGRARRARHRSTSARAHAERVFPGSVGR